MAGGTLDSAMTTRELFPHAMIDRRALGDEV